MSAEQPPPDPIAPLPDASRAETRNPHAGNLQAGSLTPDTADGSVDALFERYQPALRALVSRGVPADEVDDVVQESLLQAVRALPEFCYRGPGSFRAWLLRITERRIIDRYRRSAVGPELADETVSRLAHGHTPSGPAVARELIEARRQLLDGLPAVDRDLVKLRQEDGLGFAAIAAQLGLTGARAASRRYSELVSRYPELRGEA